MAILKSQLVSAQAENKASDYSAGTVGRFWINTSTSLLKFDDGSAVRTVVTTDNTQTLTNKLLSDSTTSIVDNSDNTKAAKFECSGITTGTTRTYTWIDANGTILSTDTPTTTKGDILAHSTKLVRVAIGTDGQVLTADSASTPGLKWATPATAPDQSYEISNVSFATSVGASALTVALKDKSGSDPSAGSPCKIGFRTATATTGTYSQRTATGALSIVVPSTATLGFAGSSATNYLYVYAIDNAGTIELAVSGSIFDEGTLLNTTSIGTGSDSISVIYSTTGRTGVAIRLIGRVKFTLATAGTWDEAGDELSLVPFQIPVVALRYTSSASTINIATATPTAPTYITTKVFDTHNCYSAAVVTIPVAGLYRVLCQMRSEFTDSVNTNIELNISKNGTDVIGTNTNQPDASTYKMTLTVQGLVSCAVGDTITAKLRQDTGGDVTFGNAGVFDCFELERVGTI